MQSRATSKSEHEAPQSGGWPLGALLVSAGKLTEVDLARILIAQREENLRFGEAARRLGLATEEDIRRALAVQFGYPYPPLGPCALDSSLSVFHRPASAEAEALRALRAQLTLRWPKERAKTMAVTAPRTAADSAHIAANLAVAFAQLGQRTLLIDANLRTPRQHELFGISPKEGLSTVLARGAPFMEALVRLEALDGLAILASGPVPPNPNELLSLELFAYLLETAPARFDFVIVDTPCALESTDAQIVAARAGTCLLTVRRELERVADVSATKELVEAAGAVMVGGVVVPGRV